MRFVIIFVLALAITSARATSKVALKNEDRFLAITTSFTTFTLIKQTTTTTSTLTTITTCTTSTAVLTTCTIGRRRRGLFYDEAATHGRSRRGLFYNDDETENKDGNVFLPAEKKTNNPSVEVRNTSADESSVIPLEIESGFTVPQGSPNRFLLAFGTFTSTSIVITTSTTTLTAICSSTTGYPLCGNAGK